MAFTSALGARARELTSRLMMMCGRGDQKQMTILWRGIRNVRALDWWLKNGGSELAPMSTTSDLSIALRYLADARTAILLRLKVRSFMQSGAPIAFLSCFDQEQEWLYPPLTFLSPTGRRWSVRDGSREILVVEVEPHLPS